MFSELVVRLIDDDFQQRFEDFRKHTDIMKLLSDLFQGAPTDTAVKYQMELIDIQNDSHLKRRELLVREIIGTVTSCYLCFIDFDNPARHRFKNCSCGPPNQKVGQPWNRRICCVKVTNVG